LSVVYGNIADERVDVIVNPTNSCLAHGGGVSSDILRKGGIEIQIESDEYYQKNKEVPQGTVLQAKSGLLPCKSLLHAVGPVYFNGESGEHRILYETIQQCLIKT
jgi:O-acetyl-ADP-ribose deacetylase (regulator of RNase III)